MTRYLTYEAAVLSLKPNVDEVVSEDGFVVDWVTASRGNVQWVEVSVEAASALNLDVPRFTFMRDGVWEHA